MGDYSNTDLFFGIHGDFSLQNGDFRKTTSPLRALWQIIRVRLGAEREDWPLSPGWMKAALSDYLGEPLNFDTFRLMQGRIRQALITDNLIFGSDLQIGCAAIPPDIGVMKLSLNVSGTPGVEDIKDFTYVWNTRERTINPYGS